MNYIEDMILDVASRLYTDGNTKVTYKGMEFGFQEVEYANPMDMSCMTMINLNIPFYLRDTINDHLGVSYESQSISWPRNGKKVSMDRKVAQSNSWSRYGKKVSMDRQVACLRLAYGKKVSMDRKVACMQLARQFVTKFLPKVDFSLKKDMHNREIEEILEVLE